MQKKILILGSRSYASSGLPAMLEQQNFNVICFNRGKLAMQENMVSGPIMEINKNPFLQEHYDVVINYILLKNESIQANLAYIDSLVEFCKSRKVEHLIHISSVSVYPNNSQLINEKSEIEDIPENKGVYASLKVAIDKHLQAVAPVNLHITFVRPGFIISDDKLPSLAGILKLIPFKIGILMGNKKTTLPVIHRNTLNEAIMRIINLDKKESVFLITSRKTETKYNFVKSRFNYFIIPLPKNLTLILAKILLVMKIFSSRQYLQVKGLFKTTVFDSSFSEKILKINL